MSAQENLYKGWTIPEGAGTDPQEIAEGLYDLPLTFTPRTILDVGANVGFFTRWARDKWPDSKVTAYEPWAENVQMFQKNINGDPGVKLVPKACFPTEALSITEGNNSLCHTAFPNVCPWIATQSKRAPEVRTVPAEIPSESFEFIKCDCEGSEFDVLRSLNLTETKAIVVECHSEEIAQTVENALYVCGFRLVFKHYHGFRDVSILKFAREGCSLPVPRKIMLAMPIYGNLQGQTALCLMRTIQSPPRNIGCQIQHHIGDSLVSRARNALTFQFLRSECTDLLFVDSDLIFSSEQIERLCSHDVAVVGGLYPKKQDGPETEFVLNTCVHKTEKDAVGLQEVAYIGTGFLRVQRDVILKMIAAHWREIMYKDDCSDSFQFDLWPVGVYHYQDGRHARYLSEDWFFCQRWIDLGGKVYADSKIVLKHIGQATFPLQHQSKKLGLT